MYKDKIEIIINNLIDSTKNNSITWVEVNSIFSKSRDYHRSYKSTAEDSTVYSIDVKYRFNERGVKLDDSPTLCIESSLLPDNLFISDNNVKKLRELIIENYCQDMNPNSNIESSLDSIANGVSKESIRDSKLKKILKQLVI